MVWFHTKYILCICLLVGSWWGMSWVGGGRLVWFPTKYKLCTHKQPAKHGMLVGSWWGSWWVGGGRLVHFPPNTNCAPTRTPPSFLVGPLLVETCGCTVGIWWEPHQPTPTTHQYHTNKTPTKTNNIVKKTKMAQVEVGGDLVETHQDDVLPIGLW